METLVEYVRKGERLLLPRTITACLDYARVVRWRQLADDVICIDVRCASEQHVRDRHVWRYVDEQWRLTDFTPHTLLPTVRA